MAAQTPHMPAAGIASAVDSLMHYIDLSTLPHLMHKDDALTVLSRVQAEISGRIEALISEGALDAGV